MKTLQPLHTMQRASPRPSLVLLAALRPAMQRAAGIPAKLAAFQRDQFWGVQTLIPDVPSVS